MGQTLASSFRSSLTTRLAGAVTGVALLGASCTSGSATSSSDTGPGATVTAAAPSGTAVALQTLTQQGLESAFARGVRATRAPGGVAVVTTPQGRFVVRSGTGTVGTDAPIQPTDHFRIGSTTKTMVGAVILQLAQEGSLKLSDPVSKFRSGVPNGDAITIEQLLNMRSGLASYTDIPEVGAAVDLDPTRAWRPEELLDLAFSKPPTGAPGAGFSYSNTNTVLLGLIAEQVDGKSLDRVLHDRLFGPLGMRNTFLPKTTSSDIPDPHTRGYLYGTNAIFLRIDNSLPPEMQAQLDAGTLPLQDVTDENPSWGWAAGAAISTADDMVTWINALAGGKVLGAEYQKLWLDKGQPTDPSHPEGIRYGLAHYSIATPEGSTLYGHSGEIPGYNTWMLRDPKNDVTIVSWANLAPNHGDEAFIAELIAQIYRPTSPPATTPRPDVSGLFDVGDGRKVYATCRGTGSPTVVLISGKGNGADDWMELLDPADPIQETPGDDLSAGQGTVVKGDDAVFPRVARFTRVCTYDRPDVRFDGEVTTPRPQPHPVDLDVSDLQSLFATIGETGPKVLVGHSYGGFVATLYARTHPSEVAGLVMVDPGSEQMAEVVTAETFDDWDKTNAMTSPQVREGVLLRDATRQINAAPPMPKVPAVVLASDKPWRVDLLPPEAKKSEMVTYANWLAQVDRVARVLGAKKVADTKSGHSIHLYNPTAVVDAIRTVVDDARRD